MSLHLLNGEGLYHSFVSGAKEVIKNKKILNDINVFPVADGDTGNNLASTMYSIIEETKVMSSVKNTMSSIADAAMLGARGNSGIIMAQYINGIFMSMEEEDELTISGFALSVKNAVPHAYSAIAEPVEGTIITVIKDWAEAVYTNKDNAKNFYDLLKSPLESALSSLKDTTYKLKALQKSKVVDSGAKGFVYFLQGLTEFMKDGKLNSEKVDNKDEILEFHTHNEENLKHRYCTEALIGKKNNTDINLDLIKKELLDLGDSLIVAGNNTKARIHIHTNQPSDVMKYLRNNSVILQQKADDMKMQYEVANKRNYKIALVTDSIADLPQELIDSYQINVVPLNLVIDESSYLDKVTVTPESLYTILDSLDNYPSSAQPSPKMAENMLSMLAQYYDEIIVITVSKNQSGTNSVFIKAAEKLRKDSKKIEIIDSRQNSGAEGLLVMKAAEMIKNNNSFEAIVNEINKLTRKTRILVSVNTIKYMVRSGRLNKTTGFLGKLLNLKPVIGLDENGKGIIEAKAFSVKSNTKKILDIVKKENEKNRITRYAVVHANSPERAEELKNKLVDMLKSEPAYIMNISTIVGMSAGIGSVAVSYMSEER